MCTAPSGVELVRAGEDASPIAKELHRTERARSEQEIFVVSSGVGSVVMPGVVLDQHHGAGTLEKLGARIRKRALPTSDLAEETQGERITVDAIQAAKGKMLQDRARIEIRETVRKEGPSVAPVERTKVKQHRVSAVVVRDPDAIGCPVPVSLAARKNEGRIAHFGELGKDRVDSSSGVGGSDLVETINNDSFAGLSQRLGTRGAQKRSGADLPQIR